MKNSQNRSGRKLFSLLLTAGILLFLLLLAGGAVFAWKYSKSASSNEKVIVTEKLAVPENITLGEKFTLKFTCRVPWGTEENLLELLSVPENMQVTSPPFFRTVKYAWGYRILQGNIPLQAFADGKSSGGVFSYGFKNRKNGEEKFEEKIPEMTVKAITVTSPELLTAEKILKKESSSLVSGIAIIAVLLLLAAGLVSFFLFRKKKESIKKDLPVWEKTFQAIRELLTKVHSGRIRTEQSVAELTDIIRFYMEKRFSIPAEHQTSDEFFYTLNKKKGLLSPSQQDFLRKFIRSADLVKFANISADTALIEEAAQQAENLVRETIPSPEETKNVSGKEPLKGKENA